MCRFNNKESRDDIDIMQCIDATCPEMSISFDGIVKLINGKKVSIKNLNPGKIKKWKNPGPKCLPEDKQNFLPFEKFQYQYYLSMGDTKKSFMCERYLGGGGFGRVFLLRPVVRNLKALRLDSSSSNSSNSSSSEATWTSTNDEDPTTSLYEFTNGRSMAIKFLKPGEMAKEVDMIQKHLKYHPNVSRPRFWSRKGFQKGIHAHQAPQNCFLIMPYLPLGSLDMFINDSRHQRKSLPPRVVRRILHQALKGLHHLHTYGYIHLDIKPGNIMFSSECTIKLVDFGEMEYIEPDNIDGVDGITHQTWDKKRGTVMFCAPELAGIFTPAGAEEDDPTFSYKDSEGKRFYYCERAGHHDSCGFNKKVDIYALGITVLSMVKGYRMLVDNEDHGNHRLTCCKLMGTYPEDMKRGKKKQVLIDGMDVEKLMKDVPACYRLPGKSDFLILLKKMLCHVNERLSARALLSERSGKTWLRILPKYDERKMNSDGTLKGYVPTKNSINKIKKNVENFTVNS